MPTYPHLETKEQVMVPDIGHPNERRRRLRRVGAGQTPDGDLIRCACQECGSHVHAVVLKQTISGLCGTCGSCDIVRLSA